jgi:hypothetical protein
MLLYGASLGVFAWTGKLWVALCAQVCVGYFYFAVMTSLQTLIQQVVDEGKRGRVMSLFSVAWAGLIPFGGFALGGLANAVGIVTTLELASLACAAVAVFVITGADRWSVPRAAAARRAA